MFYFSINASIVKGGGGGQMGGGKGWQREKFSPGPHFKAHHPSKFAKLKKKGFTHVLTWICPEIFFWILI